MNRRYLTLSEAESALNRGKSIECFLGACTRDGKPGIKWISASKNGNGINVSVFETADLGNEEFLDVYEFGPLNPELELDEADESLTCPDFESFVQEVESKFSGSSSKLVNEFIVQDEYADYLMSGRG